MRIDDTYDAKQFNLTDLKGISNRTMEMHLDLYAGYVAKVNELNERLNQYLADGQVGP